MSEKKGSITDSNIVDDKLKWYSENEDIDKTEEEEIDLGKYIVIEKDGNSKDVISEYIDDRLTKDDVDCFNKISKGVKIEDIDKTEEEEIDLGKYIFIVKDGNSKNVIEEYIDDRLTKDDVDCFNKISKGVKIVLFMYF